ncbi:XdhC family protein [Desulfotomaculum sp. 1211_IL3151]|uniref:XdhC family protein n=1 Tax=Desulfotomaculum sp. 1211_IL3151 TaxID=3084055 RepID=UPI002FDA2520
MTLFNGLLAVAERGESAYLITLVGVPGDGNAALGQMLVLFPEDRIEGELVDATFTQKVLEEIKGRQWEKPKLLTISYQQQEYQVFWNCLAGKMRAVILGGGHISQPLALFLTLLDFEVTVIDDRPEFANRQRFPKADHIICEDFTKALEQTTFDDSTAVIIVTRGHRYDLDCLRSIADQRAGYMGMIGSFRRVKAVLQLLKEEGVSTEWLNALKTPIGLDLGSQSPAEIALSIAAEIVAQFKGGNFLPLSSQRGNLNG